VLYFVLFRCIVLVLCWYCVGIVLDCVGLYCIVL